MSLPLLASPFGALSAVVRIGSAGVAISSLESLYRRADLGPRGLLDGEVLAVPALTGQGRQDVLVPGAEGQGLDDRGGRVGEQVPVGCGGGGVVPGNPGPDVRLAVVSQLCQERWAGGAVERDPVPHPRVVVGCQGCDQGL